MSDPIYEAFLERQHEEGLRLADASELLDLQPIPERNRPHPTRYLAGFSCKGLVRADGGAPTVAERWMVGIQFPPNYLRLANPYEVVSWLAPREAFHPNIAAPVQGICIGRLTPGTGLVDLLYQCWEIITWNRFKLDDCLDPIAAAWARDPANAARLPVDRRPLKRRVPSGAAS